MILAAPVAAEHRAARRARRERAPAGGRHRHRQHQARRSSRRRARCRRGSRSSAAIRSAARRRAASSTRGRICSRAGRGCCTPAGDERAGDGAREAARRSSRALGAEPRIIDVARARSAAGVSQPPAAADRQRADAGRRRRGRRRTAWRSPAAAWSTRRGWRRARPTSGATSPPPTPTKSARRSTR